MQTAMTTFGAIVRVVRGHTLPIVLTPGGSATQSNKESYSPAPGDE